jgi:hypothetical protein
VFKVSVGGSVYDPPKRLLKLPVREGETWEWADAAGRGRPSPKCKYTTVREEEVETPAGKFRAVRVEMDSETGGAVLRTTYWHTPGAGLVKIVSRDRKGDWVRVLKSFARPAGR